MADKKISALTGATTPLAGTEVLPIVQGGATVKVAVSDLTAGRAVSATQLTSTIAIGTAPLVVTSTTNVANLNASSLNGATFAAPGAIGGGTASAITGTTITGTDATDASSTTAAAIKTAGGLAVVKKIYVGDNIVPATAAKGINFTANTPAAGMTSQLLNWYEEGTWTATLTGSVTAPTLPQTATGNYTRVGRQVTVQVALENKTTVGAVGNIRVTGLPFAASGKFVGSCVAYNFGSVQFQASTANTETQLYFEDIQLNQISISAGVSKYLYLTVTYFV
jgi:hypothetical protein